MKVETDVIQSGLDTRRRVMNPFEMMQMKSKFDRFGQQHPRVVAFMQENHQELREGAVVELRITTPEGRNVVTNMRLTADDEELINTLKGLFG